MLRTVKSLSALCESVRSLQFSQDADMAKRLLKNSGRLRFPNSTSSSRLCSSECGENELSHVADEENPNFHEMVMYYAYRFVNCTQI